MTYFKQVQAIKDGYKTETRRIAKPDEWVRGIGWNAPCATPYTVAQCAAIVDADGPIHVNEVLTPGRRRKWRVGQDYAVCEGRGKPCVQVVEPYGWFTPVFKFEDGTFDTGDGYYFHETECTPLRHSIEWMRLERLQSLTLSSAIEEGYPYEWPPDPHKTYLPEQRPDPLTWYRQLWGSINPRSPWDSDPLVFVLSIEAVK